MGAAAAVCVENGGVLVRNDVEQSLKDPIRTDVGSRPQSGAEGWSGPSLKVTGTGPLTNKEVQSRIDIKAEKRDGPYSENNTLFAGLTIYEKEGCARDLKRQVNPYE